MSVHVHISANARAGARSEPRLNVSCAPFEPDENSTRLCADYVRNEPTGKEIAIWHCRDLAYITLRS